MIYEKSLPDKLTAITMFRQEGNSCFGQKQFNDALVAYKRALVYLDYAFGETDQENALIDQERLKVHLNMAAVYLEQEDHKSAENECRLAIRVNPESSKAYYRRGLAYLRQRELELAQADLYKALKLSAPESKDVRRPIEEAINELNVQVREYRRKSAQIAKAAFI
jgi:tetratricopeptide (TPR) repeat protein